MKTPFLKKHPVALAWLVSAGLIVLMSACGSKDSDDDDDDSNSNSACSTACNKLAGCYGTTFSICQQNVDAAGCTTYCTQNNGTAEANCINNVNGCDTATFDTCLVGVCN
jgi:hypothetical protein